MKFRVRPVLSVLFLSLATALAEKTPPASPRPAASPEAADPDTWAFEPSRDAFRAEAAFDFRPLNEKVAGESGFVGVKDGAFVLGDGRPARFWGITTYVGRDKPWVAKPLRQKPEPDLAHHARFLAKRGVNLAKVLCEIGPNPKGMPGARLEDFNAKDRDWVWRTVAAMKREGIYTQITMFWPAVMKVSDDWGLDAKDLQNLVYFDPTLQAAYRGWLRALFAESNPHTGIPLAADPAVAFVTLAHEDSLLFWTFGALREKPRALVVGRFTEWARKKHGSIDAALAAWDGAKLPGDGPDRLDLYGPFDLTTKGAATGNARRKADQMEFLVEIQRNFYADTVRFLREDLGCRWLVNAGNWQPAELATMGDAERFTYTGADIDGLNRYFGAVHQGATAGWKVTEGDRILNRSVLNDPTALPINVRQTQGRPFAMLESSWVAPNLYAAEGPLLVSAYSSLSGFDLFIWYMTNDDEWSPPQSATGFVPGLAKWEIATPEALGQFPAAALMFRRGDIRAGQPVLVEHRALDDLWKRLPPRLPETVALDANPAAAASGSTAPGTAAPAVSPYAFLVGPVEMVLGSDPAKTVVGDWRSFVDVPAKIVRSNTGELTFDWGRAVVRVDTPRAQGAVAFFSRQSEVALTDLRITCRNDYAAIVAVSLDGEPLATSRRVLVQVGTHSRPTGWAEEPVTMKTPFGERDGVVVRKLGTAPWRIAATDATLVLKNPHLSKATRLDVNAEPVGSVAVERRDGAISLALPRDTLYTLLE